MSSAYPVFYVSVVSSIPAILRIISKLFSNKIVVRFIFHNLKAKPWTLKNFTLWPCIYCRMCYVTWRKIRWHHWLVCLSSSDCFWLNNWPNIRHQTERRLFSPLFFREIVVTYRVLPASMAAILIFKCTEGAGVGGRGSGIIHVALGGGGRENYFSRFLLKRPPPPPPAPSTRKVLLILIQDGNS